MRDVYVQKIGDQNLVFGWASIAADRDGELLVDKDGDFITPDDLEGAVYEYVLEFRTANEMHQSVTKGHLVESLAMTPEKEQAMGLPPGSIPYGWWVGFKVDPDTFAKVKSGELRMFSIEGHADRVAHT